MALAGHAGVGPGLWISNADVPSDLGGPFWSVNFNLGFSIQFSFGLNDKFKPIGFASVSKIGAGFSVATIPTFTYTGGIVLAPSGGYAGKPAAGHSLRSRRGNVEGSADGSGNGRSIIGDSVGTGNADGPPASTPAPAEAPPAHAADPAPSPSAPPAAPSTTPNPNTLPSIERPLA